MKKYLLHFCIVLIGIAFFFLLDFFAHFCYKQVTGKSYYLNLQTAQEESQQSNYRTRHSVYHHGFKPGLSNIKTKWGLYPYSLSTNSLGLRDQTNRKILKETSQQRLILIGDSFMEGLGLPYSKTVAGFISEELEKHKIEVLNAGVTSYSTTIYLAKIDHLINNLKLEFDDLAIFIDISDCIDDVKHYSLDSANNITVINPNFDSLDNYYYYKPMLSEHSFLFAQWAYYLRQQSLSNLSRINHPRSLWTIKPDLYEKYGKTCADTMTSNLEKILGLLKPVGINLYIVIYPWPDQIYYRDLHSKQVEIWQNWTKDNKIPLLNLFPDFINFPKGRKPEKINKENIDPYFLKGDVHWNEKGSKLVAEKFLNFYLN